MLSNAYCSYTNVQYPDPGDAKDLTYKLKLKCFLIYIRLVAASTAAGRHVQAACSREIIQLTAMLSWLHA